MSKKTSAAWQHFVVVDERNARCIHCDNTVVITNGSTGNMFRHMKLKHPSFSVEKYANRKFNSDPNKTQPVIVTKEKQKSSEEMNESRVVEVFHANSIDQTNLLNGSENSSQQPSAFYLIQPCDENKLQEIDKQVLKIIVKNLTPFDLVEGEEFVKLVKMLNPSYELPNRQTLSDYMLVNLYESTVNELKCTLKDVAAVALTTDSWISAMNEHLIAFTVHYINKNLELKSNFLQCFSAHQKFNSIDIALYLEQLTSSWDLCSKILVVISDGSEDIKKAVHNCNFNHMQCFAHILNQVVEAGLEKINPFVLKIRNIVQYFKNNSMALSELYLIQNEMGLSDSKLVKYIPSKWNATFNMFINFFKNKVPLLSTIEQLQLNFLELSSVDFHYLQSAIKILVIFNSIKSTMCSETSFSLSKVPQVIHFMSEQLQNVLENTELPSDIVNMGNTMKAELKKFQELEMNDLVCQAVLLDPRFKKRGFPNNLFKEACSALQHNVATAREELIKEKNESIVSSELEQSPVESESEYFIDMWREFESKDPVPLQSYQAAASVEVDAFLNDSYLPIENNPLTYWANISNQNKFPALFDLAKRVLCIPATSVPCEQMYSKAGYVHLKRRRYLPSTKVDKILFLHHNL